MRLKTYTGATMAEAMERVRLELGDDAIIVSSQTVPDTGDVWVTVAVERADEDTEVAMLRARQQGLGAAVRTLHDHGAPLGFVDRCLDVILGAASGDPVTALTAALRERVSFAPVAQSRVRRPVMLVGAHGAGKTVTAAKLAARERLAKRTVRLISTDTERAGGVEQLAAFGPILDVTVLVADSRAELAEATRVGPDKALIVIDTAGINPFHADEIGELARLAEAAGAEPVLVLAAGGDALETSEIAAAFAAIGVRRFISTRVDAARRLGGLLAAADTPLAFAEIGTTPAIANGLKPIDAAGLARLLVSSLSQPPASFTEPRRSSGEVRS